MHKRILCVLLTALILLSLIPAMPAQAASNMKTGEKCIAILKEMEGFIKYPTYDNGQYSVGYGSGCDKDDYPNGITKEEADQLLREYLAGMEKILNDFANRHGILFSQNQFDALMLFTYNCGPNWVYGDGEFRQAVLDNASGNTFIYYITQWSAASAQLHMGLVERRLIEADMYLNGSYTNVKPSNYTYVTYNNNEGVGQVKVQGYDSNLAACVQPLPTRDGYKFLGWYTDAAKGRWVTKLTASNAAQTLYAHWQPASATPNTAPSITYTISTTDLMSRSAYDAPNGKLKGSLGEGSITVIRAEYLDASGLKWGKLPNGTWVKLGDPRKGAWQETEDESGVKVTVTGDYVNVRTGPGTEYKVVSSVKENDQIVITQVCDVKGVLWGRFRGGWLCLQYTNYSGGLTPTPAPNPEEDAGQDQGSEAFSATGTVTANQLNIRATAGTHGYVMGCYKRGDKVTITEKTMVGNVPWGRTDKGWICLTYVKLDSASETPETTVPETTVPETTAPPADDQQKPGTASGQGIPATVISKAGLNIRAGAGTNFASVGSYKSGQKIRILEQRNVAGITWGRTDKGWVSMQYVKLDDVWTSTTGIYGTVTSAGGINVRSGAGVGYAPVGNYRSGQRIIILEQTVAGGQQWGRTDLGWVSMAYVRLDVAVEAPGVPETTVPETTKPEATEPEATEPETEKPEQTPGIMTGVITAGGLNVRKTPGIQGAIVGGYSRGDRVTILEKTTVNGAAWGRTDKGWISLAYVKLDAPAEPEIEAGDTVTVTASELCIRKGPGTGNAIVGAYKRGQSVTILEITKVGTTAWGRTDKGWICMDYVE